MPQHCRPATCSGMGDDATCQWDRLALLLMLRPADLHVMHHRSGTHLGMGGSNATHQWDRLPLVSGVRPANLHIMHCRPGTYSGMGEAMLALMSHLCVSLPKQCWHPSEAKPHSAIKVSHAGSTIRIPFRGVLGIVYKISWLYTTCRRRHLQALAGRLATHLSVRGAAAQRMIYRKRQSSHGMIMM